MSKIIEETLIVCQADNGYYLKDRFDDNNDIQVLVCHTERFPETIGSLMEESIKSVMDSLTTNEIKITISYEDYSL